MGFGNLRIECPQLVGGISDAQKTVSDLTEKGFGGTVGFVDAPPFILGRTRYLGRIGMCCAVGARGVWSRCLLAKTVREEGNLFPNEM